MTTLALEQRDTRLGAVTQISGIIGFYFAFRLLAVVIAVRFFDADPQVGVGTSLMLNYFFLLLAGFVSFGPGTRRYSWFCSITSFRWALAFIVFSGCSLFWTQSASLSAAIAFWVGMASDFVMVVLLLRIGSIEETVDTVMKGYVWGSCAIALIAWLLPAQSDLRLGDEDYLGANQIGYQCALAFFFAQYLMRSGIRGMRIPAVLLAITMVRSLSKTTLIAFFIAQGFLIIRDRSISAKAKLLIVCATSLVVATFWSLLAAYYDVYTNTGNQAETLTGRIGIWAFIFNEALQQPWIGHGFHSVWKVIPPFGVFEARHAHNELLQQFYAYGVIGVAIFVCLYSSVFREIRKMQTGAIRMLLFAILLFVSVRGAADTEVFDLSLPLWTIALIGSTIAEQAKREPVVPEPEVQV
jgi:O-antigen ligase